MRNLNYLFVMIISIFLINSCTEKSDLPDPVNKTFKEMFSGAKKVKWEKEGEVFEAAFLLNGEKMEAEFNADGGWLATETTIETGSLPAEITTAIETNYPDSKINEVEKVRMPDFNGYEIEIKKDGKEMDVFINMSGKIIKIEKEGEDNEKEEKEDED